MPPTIPPYGFGQRLAIAMHSDSRLDGAQTQSWGDCQTRGAGDALVPTVD